MKRTESWFRRGRPPAAGSVGPKFVASLARGLSLLSCFSVQRPYLGVAELSRDVNLPLSTVKRMVRTLALLGYLQHEERLGKYSLGPAALALSALAPGPAQLRDFAAPFMQELAEETGVSVALGSRQQLSMVCIEVSNASGLVTLNMEVGMELPLAESAIGRAYLAVCPESERRILLETTRAPDGVPSTSLQRAIDRSIASYAALGACSSFGEWRPDVNGVAVGLRPAGSPTMSITCGAPAARASPQYMLDEVRPRLLEFVRRIELGMYGRASEK
ncbi:MAG TPA: IclR family transcriptional regulator [Steroidobacter sp.]|nr:IclR family transcriptional regulator [Steroidobacteraceae bacterium]HLS80149.1 IclR family transcriptional regulator [Steroidobacter sp.]